jgi:hypothetical protein
MNKKMDWMPPVRHKRSQNAGVVYTLVDDVMAVVDALIKISFRPEGDVKPRRRPVKSEAIRRWSGKTEIGAGRFIGWLDITASKFYDWRERYGKVNEHNCWVPRHFWLEDWEKQAIIGSTPHSAERAGGQPRSVQAESRTASSEC